MSNTPKVSIIVPVYNTEKYLRKCLDSLVNQTLQDIEIILVNDGSKDGSPAILEEYKAKYPDKIKLFHKENGGQATARNLALRNCTGEFIGFLDSDDYVKEEMFERLYNKAKECNADYVSAGYTDVLITDTEERVLKEYVGNKPCKEKSEMFIGSLANPLHYFFKGDLIRNNNVTFTEGCIYEDTAFWLKALPHVKNPAYLEEPLAYHVHRENSTMTVISLKRAMNIFPVLSDAIKYYKDGGFWDEYKYDLEYFCSRILLCSGVDRISLIANRKDRKEMIEKTYSFLKENLPQYKKNPVLAKQGGMKNKYIKHSRRIFTKLLVLALRKGWMKGTTTEYASVVKK